MSSNVLEQARRKSAGARGGAWLECGGHLQGQRAGQHEGAGASRWTDACASGSLSSLL